MNKILTVLFMILFVSGCRSMPTAQTVSGLKAPLMGIIHNLKGAPLSGVDITVDESGTAVSDINGRFILSDIELGLHSFSFKQEGYETVQRDLSFSAPAQILYTTLVSFDDLLEKISTEIRYRNIEKSKALIARAERIYSDSPKLRYLHVLLLLKAEKYQEALAGIKELINEYPANKVLLLTETNIKNIQGGTNE